MASATKGVILECDVTTKQFITSLDEKLPAEQKIILSHLDSDVRLFVKADALPLIEEKLAAMQEQITFAPPASATH